MLSLENLSRIGFGGYRVSSSNKGHYHALLYAFTQGCNLIDTSANYMNGESEKLIGDVLSENAHLEAFVITKAGYIQNNNLEIVQKLNKQGICKEDLMFFSDNFGYSIHPNFLSVQIDLSASRLRQECLDGFLLHNPEHYFDQGEDASQEEYYSRIKKAFEFLEEKVSENKIRYYGISSNTFPSSTSEKSTTNLHRVLAIASEISKDHHFRLIQFPFNLVETDAMLPHHGGASLISLAKENNLITFINRPLNAKNSLGTLRLATYGDELRQLDEDRDRKFFDDCLGLIDQQLQRLGMTDEAMDFTIIQLLNANWMQIDNPEAVDQIFQEHFFPFLARLYEGGIPEKEKAAFFNVYTYASLYAKKRMTRKALSFRKELVERGIIRQDDRRPLPLIACEYYLNSGIDHVLVGMRNAKYVDCLKPLF